MNTQDNENLKRVVVLIVLLIAVLTFALMPRDAEGATYILSVAGFAGLMAAWIFVDTSIRRIKGIAEQISDEIQAGSQINGKDEQVPITPLAAGDFHIRDEQAA